MSIKTAKTVAAVILIWAACAPVTYALLKRDWVRPRHNIYNFEQIVRSPWTVRARSLVVPVCALGPFSLLVAVVVTVSNALPESDPNAMAEW